MRCKEFDQPAGRSKPISEQRAHIKRQLRAKTRTLDWT